MPDAEPRVEAIRGSGGTSKPYAVLGRAYRRSPTTGRCARRGLASWYGRQFHGQSTASGEPYDMYAMTAAHKTLPLPSYVRVRNPANGREAIVRVNDRGPFHDDRIIDLSYTAALKLDLLRGVAPVEIERITNEDIRTGAWRRGDEATALAQAPATAPPEAPAGRGAGAPGSMPVAATPAATVPPAGMVVTALAPLPPLQPAASPAVPAHEAGAPVLAPTDDPAGFWFSWAPSASAAAPTACWRAPAAVRGRRRRPGRCASSARTACIACRRGPTRRARRLAGRWPCGASSWGSRPWSCSALDRVPLIGRPAGSCQISHLLSER